MAKFYVGVDLHTRSVQICVIDKEGKKISEGALGNDLSAILEFLSPFEPGETEVVIESTINWYWLVDGLMEIGYTVKLAHTLGLYMITGAKVKTDRRDAHKLARLLRLREIPEGYIYPAATRPQRDLLRRRTGLVRERASMYSSTRVQLIKHNLNTMSLHTLKQLRDADIEAMPMPEETKWYCRMTLERTQLISRQIEQIDDALKEAGTKDPRFVSLLTLPGVHYTLALVIYYEAGDVSRFADSRHFASYCRLVPAISESGGKSKRGTGSKQGNPNLKYAFTQAANISVRYYPSLRAFRDRHMNKRKGNATKMIANCILAHKLATAAFHILRDGRSYEEDKLFSTG